MGLMSFLANYGAVKGQQAGGGIMTLIVKWDPEGATEAQIQVWAGELDKITHQRQVALAAFKKEKGEADQEQASYNRELKVAETLQRQLQEARDAGRSDQAASLEVSLGKQLTKLEAMKPNVDREVQEAKDAEAFLGQWSEAAELLGKKIVTGRQSATAAKRRMDSAEMKVQREKEKAQQAEILAGVRSQTDKMGSAIEAMEARAQKLEGKAEEVKYKAEVLTRVATVPAEEVDPNIAAAREAVDGVKPPQSLEDRLAALK